MIVRNIAVYTAVIYIRDENVSPVLLSGMVVAWRPQATGRSRGAIYIVMGVIDKLRGHHLPRPEPRACV